MTTPARWRWVVVGVVAYAALTLGIFAAYTSQRDAVPDFYIEWVGTRVALTGGNPYSQQTTDLIQLTMKGRPSGPGEDQLAFVYPLYRVFLSAPIAFLPYAWATALWLAAMAFCLVGGVGLTLSMLDWRPRPWELAAVLAASIFTFPAFGAVMLGQMAVGVFALLCLAGWAEVRNRPALAGAALALATVKPQLAALPILALAAWWLARREWRGFAGLAAGLAALTGLACLIMPDWPVEFVRTLSRYPSYKDVRTGPEYLLAGLGPAGVAGAWALWAALAVWLTLTWRSAVRGLHGPFAAAYVLTLAMACILLPQTSIINALLCLPACLLALRQTGRETPARRLRWLGLALALVVVPWLTYAAFYDRRYGLAMALPPLLAAVWFLAAGRPAFTSRRQPDPAPSIPS